MEELEEHPHKELGQKRKLAIGLLLLAPVLLVLLTFTDLLFLDHKAPAIWRSEEVWFFGWGCLFWGVLGFLRLQPSYLYVFAHEMTHVLTSRMSGGRIIDMKISNEGGYIDTDKTSTFITLSPYFIPLYATMMLCVYGIASVVIDMQVMREWLGFGELSHFKAAWIFYFLIGLTWCFHVGFTTKVLGTEQSDLKYNGEFFSMMLIFMLNILFLAVLYVAASPVLTWSAVFQTAKKYWFFG